MEYKENLPSRQLENFRNISSEIISAENGFILKNCSDEQIKQALRYGITLLGLSSEKIPTEENEKMFLIIQTKRAFPELFLSELRQSFEYAAQGVTIKKTDTYNTFSVRMISEIVNSYLSFKKQIKKQLPSFEEKMNNNQRGEAVFSLISKIPGAIDELKTIGQPKKKQKVVLPELPYNDVHQEWIRRFDKLRLKYETPNTNGRFINRYGFKMNIEMYFQKKADQLEMLRNRNNLKSVCDVCGSSDVIEAPHMGKNCNSCNPL